MSQSRGDVQIRTITEDEFSEWQHATAIGFGEHSTDARLVQIRGTTEIDRTIGAFSGGRIVGTTNTHSFEITVPGGAAPMAYLDWVAVLPTHRRQGILSKMMERHFSDVRERGEVFAGLTSSESAIYERFGYGIASWGEDWTIRRERASLADTPSRNGRTRFVEPAEARAILPRIYDRVRQRRAGRFSYDTGWWDAFASDPMHWRLGASALFHVVYEGDGGPDGLVSYRIRRGSEVVIVLLLGATSEAASELWRYCFGIDLMTSTFAPNRPVDDPLPWMLTDPRSLERSVRDQLWLRLIDVPLALSARSYASDCSVVLDVRDSFCPWNEGRYVLETGPDGAVCKPSNRSPDLALSVSELASAYLGGTTLATLQRAGRIDEHRVGALRTLDRALATDRPPWTVEF